MDTLRGTIKKIKMAKLWSSIIQRTEDGRFLRDFPTIQSASDLTGIKKKSIFKCCEANRNSDEMNYEMAGGYIWQYGYEK